MSALEDNQLMADQLVSIAAIRTAAERIMHIAVKTPLIQAQFPRISGHGTGKQIWLKAESLQPIGAFKIRGAANKILQLTPDEIARGVITYSSGNHAQGVAYAAREVGAKAVIVMPSNAPAIKRAATLALGAEVVDVGLASSERLAVAERLVREHGYVVIPPYDDEQIIAGQATCGLEIVEALPDVDLVLAPVSGGGLLGGVAASVKQLRPEAKIFGVEPELAGDTSESFRAGVIATWPAELDQPHHRRWPAHTECGRAQLRPHPGLCRRNHHRHRSRDSRRHARHRGRHAPRPRAQRSRRRGRTALSRRRAAGLSQSRSRRQRRQRRPGTAGQVLTESETQRLWNVNTEYLYLILAPGP